jgi:phospholipid/cholesterol/gamma-HCH transport system permease protein
MFFKNQIEKLGAVVMHSVGGLGVFTDFCMKVFYWTFKPPFRHALLLEQIVFVGNKSLFIILLTSLFSGMVFAYQTYMGFAIIDADSLIGPVVAISIAKELAPVFTGLVVAGRCGAAMAAQIGSMKVTEQIDALEVMGINSIQYLAAPRVWASAFALPLLSGIFLLVGNVGSYFVGTVLLDIDSVTYFSKVSEFLDIEDILEGLIKAHVFGIIISLIGTYQGFHVVGGAEGVGRATNMAVVWGMVVVLILDFFLTSILVQLLGTA